MATASFRSATRRDSTLAAEDAGSATRGRAASSSDGGGGGHRRSRSLSRFPPPTPSPEHAGTPASRFVNKVRGGGGGGFPEISLDDLADEFFRARVESEDDEEVGRRKAETHGRRRFPSVAAAERGSGRRSSTARYARETESSRQRGRSVSRPPSERRDGAAAAVNGGAAARRQRYASVDRHTSRDRPRWHDSEIDLEVSHQYGSKGMFTKSGTGDTLQNSFCKPTKLNQALRRSASQKDLLQSRDSSSSHSSLTDDESHGAHSFQSRNAKTIQAFYAVKKEHPPGDEEGNVLYEAMRKEVRYAVEEIRTELGKVVTKPEPAKKVISTDAQPTQVIAELRRSYTSKLEESEKRKQELLAQLAAEQQRGHELTKIVKELLPTPKRTANPERQSRCRRRSNDRARMSRHLTEEAERYFEDFVSNVEDTDFSSFDGERSDTSSTRRDVVPTTVEIPIALNNVASATESDDVVFPWLKWETSNDLQISPYKTKTQGASVACSTSNHSMSSRGSWSPGDHDSSSVSKDKLLIRFGEVGIHPTDCTDEVRTSSFHMDDYVHLKSSDDLLFERWWQKQRIDAGGLVLCSRSTTM